MLHHVGVSFDLYYDARKHKIKTLTYVAADYRVVGLSVAGHVSSPSESQCCFLPFSLSETYSVICAEDLTFTLLKPNKYIRTLHKLPGFFLVNPVRNFKHTFAFHITATASKILTEERVEETRNSDRGVF